MAAAGTVTLLFTDLVDSTPMLEELGDAGNEPLRRAHARLLRSEVEAHDGRPVKDMGDGIMAAFSAPSDAVQCAIAVQQAIGMHNRTPGSRPLGVRIGIHIGEVTEDGGDYFGKVVVVAERLCRKAAAGEIVTSDLVRAIAAGRSDIEFEDLGALELKGFSTPVPAARVVFDEAPHALGLRADRSVAFVGRHRELSLLDEVWAAARTGQRALVLISGEPGIGKTRLALTHAERTRDAGAVVLVGRCEENAPLPFLPFTEALAPHADL
ncbi:MAG TPA: adenylate/guanylate cyclase domain-containing protein, partial [Acidimicrobiales bacterium]|nr:adenylate/guanylate cyclase domain-containing protein [Acidimicrobiales bacterium]